MDDLSVDFLLETGEYPPETRLWRAVLLQAIMDSSGRIWDSNASVKKKNISDAVAWFRGKKDFRLVCLMAGLNPEYVKRKLENL